MAPVPGRGGWAAPLLSVVAAGLLVTGVVTVIVREGDEPSAVAVLDRARQFVERASSVRLDARVQVESAGESGDLEDDSTFVERYRLRGALAFPDRYRFIADAGDEGDSEVLRVGDRVFVRAAGGSDEWYSYPYEAYGVGEEEPRDMFRLIEPTVVSDVLAGVSRPRVVRRDGNRVIMRAQLLPRLAFGRSARGVQAPGIDLVVRDDGRVERMRFILRDEDQEARADIRLGRWNEGIEIEAPPADEVEAADGPPVIDEEEVLAFRHAPLVQPAVLPEGWGLVGATVLDPEETVEGCEQVMLQYSDATADDSGFLEIFLLAPTCADPQPPRGADTFQAGPHAGYVMVDEGVALAQITAGATVVQAESDLVPDDLAVILAELRPLDFDTPAATRPGLGRRLDAS